MADDAPQQVNTYWTGGAGDGDWSNPDNWSDGVPLPGATYTDGRQDQATIDQSYTGGPVSVVISGAQGGTDSATVALDVNAPPTIGAPPSVVGHAGDSVAVSGVLISDPDANSASETLTVTLARRSQESLHER